MSNLKYAEGAPKSDFKNCNYSKLSIPQSFQPPVKTPQNRTLSRSLLVFYQSHINLLILHYVITLKVENFVE
jgi:hypothetical protein